MRIVYVFIMMVAFACRPSNQINEMVEGINERPLEGTVWLLRELNGKEIVQAADQRKLSVFYEAGAKNIHGFAGCNTFTGSYTKDGSTVSAILASTRMFCDGKMEVETAFIKALTEPNHYVLEGSHLFLKNKGNVVAKFLPEVNAPK